MRVALPAGVLPGGRFDQWRPPARISYVVCDVDGTLVGPAELASSEVVAAVARLQATGVRVGVATGRMRDAVGPLAAQVGFIGPHVLHNGAEVRDGGRTVAAWPLGPQEVDGLLVVARHHNDGYVEIYPESGYLVSRRDDRARPHWGVLGAPPRGRIVRASDLGGAPVLKATFTVFDARRLPALTAAVEALGLSAGPAGSPRTPHLHYVNATHPEADKGRALLRAAAHVHARVGSVAAVGDAANDLPMLTVAGTAVAMGQAPAEVRAAAHLVAPDVDADGLGVALDAVRSFNAQPRPGTW